MRLRGWGIAGALVLSAFIVAVLAPPALAGKTIYSGPLLGPPAQNPGSSKIYFKVTSQGKGRKAHPVMVLKLKVINWMVSCTDSQGNHAQPYAVSYSPFGVSIPVNKRQFDVSYTLTAPYGYSGSQTFETQGRIPRRGPVTGTARYTGSWVAIDTGPVTCDTTTSWRATIDRSGNFPE